MDDAQFAYVYCYNLSCVVLEYVFINKWKCVCVCVCVCMCVWGGGSTSMHVCVPHMSDVL